MIIVKKFWRELSILTLATLLIICYFTRQPTSKLEEIREKLTESEMVVYKLERDLEKRLHTEDDEVRIITEIITKPDGTKIEKEEKVEKRAKVFEEISDKEKVSDERIVIKEVEKIVVKKVENSGSKYSVGVYHPVALDYDKRRLEFDFGAQVGGFPVELVVGSRPYQGEWFIGGRFRW